MHCNYCPPAGPAAMPQGTGFRGVFLGGKRCDPVGISRPPQGTSVGPFALIELEMEHLMGPFSGGGANSCTFCWLCSPAYHLCSDPESTGKGTRMSERAECPESAGYWHTLGLMPVYLVGQIIRPCPAWRVQSETAVPQLPRHPACGYLRA